MKYLNNKKFQARGWAWNQICKRIPNKFARRRARIFCLIGDTTLELETAERKGFSPYNVIGVDVKKEAVKRWREAGGLAIQAPIEAVIAMSKIPPQGVIADFCSGLTDKTLIGFQSALINTKAPGAVIINLLRGRDDIEKFRSPVLIQACAALSPHWEQMLKRRSVVLLLHLFENLVLNNPSKKEEIDELKWYLDQNTRRAARQLDMAFLNLFEGFMKKLHPGYHEYKSADSGQWFDSLAINAFGANTPLTDIEVAKEMSHIDVPLVRRRLAALEAIRTQRINRLSAKKQILYIDEDAA